MKSLFCSLLVVAFLPLGMGAQEVAVSDSTGLPGDNFSLEAAIELFKKAESPEDFEKMLNSESNGINNLDLNEDGQTDYIRVIDNMDGDVHAIVLQVPVSEQESQDIAVIEIEKTGAEEAILQIIGDEDIYGKQIIAEPFEEENGGKGKGGPSVSNGPIRIVVNVWLWPSVRFVYRPGYRVYVSPWRWAYYPNYWRPWRPHPWRVYHVRVRPYRVHVHVVPTHRVVRAHTVYTPHRSSSKVVHTRTTTKVYGPKGNVKASKTTTTTKATGRHGNTTTHQKTTTKVQKGKASGSRTTTKTTRKRG